MYDWLLDEIAKVRTRKFHVTDGPISPEFRKAVEGSKLALPPSYKDFVMRFGNTKLYRRSSYWLIEVYAGPREAVSADGERLIQFGRTHTSLAYFKESLLTEGGESPVFEWRHNRGLQQTSAGFLEWIQSKCRSARKQYKKTEWEAIERGPSPFTQHELAIVQARNRFQWRVIGIVPNGDLRFEIHNGSRMILPYLSLGVRGRLRAPKDGPLEGGVYLAISGIGPGETRVIEHGCYKEFVAPEDIEVFELPDPGPEDRGEYWEFKTV